MPLHVQAQDDRPNVVLILADDLGYGDLSSYGADDMQTPNIDALVDTGMRFDRFYANSSVCSPTRAALLTGRYQERVGVPGVVRTHAHNSWGYLSPEAVMIGDVVKQQGYHTGMVGKWHLGLESPNTPWERGFDYTYVFIGDMMDDYYTHRRHGLNYMREYGGVIHPEGHATELFTQESIEYVTRRSNSEAPFFLYLPYNAPHAPIQPPEEWLEKVKQREKGISNERAKLVALIEQMDECIGRIVKTLKETDEYENTLILFTSDNGGAEGQGASNGSVRGQKGDMYEGGIRVPMVAAWPRYIEAGSRSGRVALTMDLFPTIAEAVGARIDHKIEGRSILPTLLGDKQNELDDREVVFSRREGNRSYMGKTTWALRRGNWKLLQNRPTQPFELYNLAEDPKEQFDLAKKNEQKYDDMAERLRRHIQQGGRVPWQKP